ncbi:MAG: DUF2127 domain-containing protein [Anaerolineae bacterium]
MPQPSVVIPANVPDPPDIDLSQPIKPHRRPFGLYAIIVLEALAAVITLGLAYLLWRNAPTLFTNETERLNMYGSLSWDIIRAIIQLVAAIGLWYRRQWAWLATMLLTGLSMATDLWNYVNKAEVSITLAISIAIVFYLNQRDVQQQFVTPKATHTEAAYAAH